MSKYPYLSDIGRAPYNERLGKWGGQVKEGDFSIEGKSWRYRDPEYDFANNNRLDRGNPRGYGFNPYAKDKYNDLYDYEFDVVRKAGKELGIDDVDTKKEVRQIIKHIENPKPEGEKEPKTKYEPSPLPDNPYGGKNRPVGYPNKKDMPGAGDFGTNRPPGSIPYIPPSSDEGRDAYGTGGKTSLDTAIESVADYGNRATDDYFGRFLPEMGRRNTNEAKASGRSILKGIQDFTGKIPELGDPKKLFDFYMGKID